MKKKEIAVERISMIISKIILSVICSLCAVVNYAQNVTSYIPTNGLFGSYTFYVNAYGQSGNGNICKVIHTALASDKNGIVSSAYTVNGISSYIQANFNILIR